MSPQAIAHLKECRASRMKKAENYRLGLLEFKQERLAAIAKLDAELERLHVLFNDEREVVAGLDRAIELLEDAPAPSVLVEGR